MADVPVAERARVRLCRKLCGQRGVLQGCGEGEDQLSGVCKAGQGECKHCHYPGGGS